MVAKEREDRDDRLSDLEQEGKKAKEVESDYEPARDSLSSQGDAQSFEENKGKRASRVPRKLTTKKSTDGGLHTATNGTGRRESNKLQYKTSGTGQKITQKPSKGNSPPKQSSERKSDNMKVHPKSPSESSSEQSEGADDKTVEDIKEIDILDEGPNQDQSTGTDDETVDMENNGDDDKISVYQEMEEMQLKIDKLEEELREVAALEISLYSVVPEHGSSAHKVHTPARRLSRLYIHACKYCSQNKRATVARNTISGLVLVAKSCGSDLPRLTFWLSNTIVLRAIISQSFGILDSNLDSRVAESNGSLKKENGHAFKWKTNGNTNQMKGISVLQLTDDWQDSSTFTTALEKIESWIFSRIVESVWWQAMTPHMQSPVEDLYSSKNLGKLLGPALGDQQQGSFSINLWKSAFNDAFTKLCPLRAVGHECGCLPVLARLVMEQCVSRLDVAMFNAILRESANEIPTDPVSDPIVDPKVLPIPAGDLSFGSGAQLKNSIGNWSRWLTDLFGMDAGDSTREGEIVDGYDDRRGGNPESKSFRFLNELSDLLMLPKDMLLDKAVRKEVCPSIGLSLVTRVLCNFTPDEFCPDSVPGVVLEELNIEGMMERHLADKDLINSFPCIAAPVVYTSPSSADIAEKMADAGRNAELDRRASIIQRKGYTSDDDLDELDSPLTSVVDKTPLSSPSYGREGPNNTRLTNVRYRLLREVWSE